MELRWIASSSASALHASAAIGAGEKLVDESLAKVLAEPTAEIERELAAAGVGAEAFWKHVVPLAAGIENNRQLADVVLKKIVGLSARRDLLAQALSHRIADLEKAFREACPHVVEELELRSGPLRKQWEARGKGLLRRLGERTEPDLLVERAEVVLVYPAKGGSGAVHLAYNSVRIEAVLADPHAELPEAVRLAWLVAQLNIDLPRYSERLDSKNVLRLAGLAMLPPVLEAANYVEWVGPLAQCLPPALSVWCKEAAPKETAQVVFNWWQTFVETRPAWSVALMALERMLGESRGDGGC